MKVEKIKFELVDENSKAPHIATDGSVGMDFFARERTVVNGVTLVPLGVKMHLPSNHWLDLRPRSSMAIKKGLLGVSGVIDTDYRKEICAVFMPTNPTSTIIIEKGDKVAQGMLREHIHPILEQGDIEDNERGGFGSTGEK